MKAIFFSSAAKADAPKVLQVCQRLRGAASSTGNEPHQGIPNPPYTGWLISLITCLFYHLRMPIIAHTLEAPDGN